MNRAELKERAKKSLDGKYGDAIVMMIFMGLATGFVSALTQVEGEAFDVIFSLVGGVLNLVVSGLLTFGMLSFYLRLVRGEEVTWRELYSKTSMFIPYILISLLTGIFCALWSILFVIPGIIAALGYSQVYYIALDNPDMDPMDVLKESKRMMDGHKMEYFTLILSFLGWILLGVLTLGILYLWLTPYMSATSALYYDELKKQVK